METLIILLTGVVAWHVLRANYQRSRIVLLGRHLAELQLEKYMQTLTEGYTRAIHEQDDLRQMQVFNSFSEVEQAVARQVRALAHSMQNERAESTRMGTLPLCVPYIERVLPPLTRDFRELLHIHAKGLQHVVENSEQLAIKDRAYHLSAELFLFQHSCHWFCKSRAVADARLALRHQVKYEQVLESVSPVTRTAYMAWRQGTGSKL